MDDNTKKILLLASAIIFHPIEYGFSFKGQSSNQK
jgi:hypothetical protein